MQDTGLTTAQAALEFLLATIEESPDPDLLTDTLTRLGTVCGGRPDNEMLLAKFEGPFKAERGRLRLIEALKVAKRIGATE